ncbi:uncharacterized protein [Littorina saxatilis]|uniref:Uncharacterized protein n=1 Tax=Littorina saxatilis TaxID=31220 RepID=A0AAN9BSV2_9CAEN
MHSRESIPNVGRRARGSNSTFMLKGSGAKEDMATSSLVQDQGDRVVPSASDPSGDQGDSEWYNHSALSQPGHPYNRIVEKILQRQQQMAHRHRLNGDTHTVPASIGQHLENAIQAESRTLNKQPISDFQDNSADKDATYRIEQVPATERAQRQHRATRRDRAITDRVHSMERAYRATEKTHRATDRASSLERTYRPQQRKDTGPRWLGSIDKTRRWSDGNQRQPRGKPSQSDPDDQCVPYSLDLSRGCITDRTYLSMKAHGDDDLYDLRRGGSLDTTRIEPSDVQRLPGVTRKRDPAQLEELLDYLWVYQGMGRQVLDVHMPVDARLFKKPMKLPAIQSIREKQEFSTAEDISSTLGEGSEDSFLSSERRAFSEPAYLVGSLESQESQSSPSDLDSQRSEKREVCPLNTHSADFDSAGRRPVDSNARTDVGESRKRTVKVVVKMPVILTQEMTCADLLEHD